MPRRSNKNRKRPDLKRAAKELGVSYSHLRLVVSGERISYKLLGDYLLLTYKWIDLPMAPLPKPQPQNKKIDTKQ